MENLIHKITIREWSYYSKSGDISGLKKHGINTKNIDSVIAIVDENLGEKQDLQKETNKLNSTFKIQELLTYYRNLQDLMVHQLNVELILLELNIKAKLNENVDVVIKEKTKQLNDKHGIVVVNLEDLKKIDVEINRRLDKFAEYNKQKIQTDGITFSKLVRRVFKILDYDKIDFEMVLSDFFDLKKEAIEYIKKEK